MTALWLEVLKVEKMVKLLGKLKDSQWVEKTDCKWVKVTDVAMGKMKAIQKVY